MQSPFFFRTHSKVWILPCGSLSSEGVGITKSSWESPVFSQMLLISNGKSITVLSPNSALQHWAHFLHRKPIAFILPAIFFSSITRALLSAFLRFEIFASFCDGIFNTKYHQNRYCLIYNHITYRIIIFLFVGYSARLNV